MEINAAIVKELREKTGVGMMECKKALEETQGDMEKAVDLLRKKGILKAAKRAGRSAANGFIASYIHHSGTIGVMVELNCETDFVAKNNEFQALGREIAIHVAASNPSYINRDEVSPEIISKESEIYRAEVAASGKPPQVVDKIVEGKLEKFYKDNCLLEQPFVRDDKVTVQDLIHQLTSKIGEKIEVGRFVRFQVGTRN